MPGLPAWPVEETDVRSRLTPVMRPVAGFDAVNVTPRDLILGAFDLPRFAIADLPSWAEAERFDVRARAGDLGARTVSRVPGSAPGGRSHRPDRQLGYRADVQSRFARRSAAIAVHRIAGTARSAARTVARAGAGARDRSDRAARRELNGLTLAVRVKAINGPGGEVSGRGSLIGTGGGSDGGVSGIWSGSIGSSGSSRIGSSGPGPGLFLFSISTANRDASGVPSVNLRVFWLHSSRAEQACPTQEEAMAGKDYRLRWMEDRRAQLERHRNPALDGLDDLRAPHHVNLGRDQGRRTRRLGSGDRQAAGRDAIARR